MIYKKGCLESDKGEHFELDKTSMARLRLIAVIMRLTDLHRMSNVGYVVSDHHGRKKTKFAMIDFAYLNKGPVNCTGASLIAVLNCYNKISSGKITTEAKKFANLLTESDYIDAFRKIEENFPAACDEVAASINAMPFESDKRKADFAEKLDIWKSNFKKIQKLVNETSHQQQVRHAFRSGSR